MLAQRLVAHRGYQALYPENTLLSLSRAIEAGARYIETDILFSADGQPVLYHDVLMMRISGMKNGIHLMTLAELQRCPAFEPERLGNRYTDENIATLENLAALLQTHQDTTAFVELKRAGLHLVGAQNALEKVTAILDEVLDRVVLISFDNAFIEYAHHRGFSRLGMVLQQWQDLAAPVVSAIQPEFVFCDQEKIPGDVSLDLPNTKLVVYEVTDPEQAVDLFQRGADMVETFDIAGMLNGLAHHAL